MEKRFFVGFSVVTLALVVYHDYAIYKNAKVLRELVIQWNAKEEQEYQQKVDKRFRSIIDHYEE